MAEPFDDIETYRRDLFRTIRTLWIAYTCVIVFAWAVMPWRLGWRGVGTCLWLTLWWAWGPGWYAFTKWLQKQMTGE